jgi:hypothetical protein
MHTVIRLIYTFTTLFANLVFFPTLLLCFHTHFQPTRGLQRRLGTCINSRGFSTRTDSMLSLRLMDVRCHLAYLCGWMCVCVLCMCVFTCAGVCLRVFASCALRIVYCVSCEYVSM